MSEDEQVEPNAGEGSLLAKYVAKLDAEYTEEMSADSLKEHWLKARDVTRNVSKLRQQQAATEEQLRYTIDLYHALAQVGLRYSPALHFITREQLLKYASMEKGRNHFLKLGYDIPNRFRAVDRTDPNASVKRIPLGAIVGVKTLDGDLRWFDEPVPPRIRMW